MEDLMNEASRWRVELARELVPAYSEKDGVRMIGLGGSAARGTSDRWSDLDVVVYWDEIDEEWIESVPLRSVGLERTDMMNMSPGTCIESYHLEGLKVDFGHVTLAMWEEWLGPIMNDNKGDPELIGMVGGFLDSIPLHGETLFREWEARLKDYSDELAEDVIKRNMGIYVKGYLTHQCFERGDLLAFQDGMCSMLKKMISISAALNRKYYSGAEPRWIDHHLEGMKFIARELTGDNVRWMLNNPGEESERMLYGIVEDTLTLIAERFPELVDRVEAKRHRLEALSVKPCTQKPELIDQ
jgi:predicted nucleotidyltransferase